MTHRTHDHLFAAAGVTAALSLIGTGVTVLKGSVFHFDRWPNVAGDLARRVQLPVAPLTQAERRRDSERRRMFATVVQADGTVVVPGLGTGDGITSVGLRLNCNSGTSGVAGGSNAEVIGAGSSSGVTLDGYAGSLGSATSSSVDGTRDPVASSTGPIGATRVASGAFDNDGDGVPDTWESDHGAPSGIDSVPVTPDAGSTGRDAAASAFRRCPTRRPTCRRSRRRRPRPPSRPLRPTARPSRPRTPRPPTPRRPPTRRPAIRHRRPTRPRARTRPRPTRRPPHLTPRPRRPLRRIRRRRQTLRRLRRPIPRR
jgi:hypothetical protein